KVGKGELDLSPEAPAGILARRVLASSAAHPSRAVVAGRSLTVLRASEAEGEARALAEGLASGGVRFAGKRLLLGAADGALEVLSCKPDGKQAMDAKAFAAGVRGIKDGNLTWEEPRV